METVSFQAAKLLLLKPVVKLWRGPLPQYHLLRVFILYIFCLN